MGRSKNKSRRNRRENTNSQQNENAQTRDGGQSKPGGYKLTVKENALFEEYYKMQCLVPTDEWENFLTALKQPLPCTFRITGYVREAQDLLRIVKSDYLNKLIEQPPTTDPDNESPMKPPKQLPWYPGGMAWQLDLDRRRIKMSETLKGLHNFLIQETESGYMSRQEAVSMLPPLVLDVKPHHKVLDMCAAPGSKTAQLIEMLHSDETKPVPEGFVVANDADNKRCYLMAHQVKRLPSPNFVIINHDASCLPNISVTSEEISREWLRYDRVLADVPCSGDGTMRKNPDVWRKWTPGPAHSLHGLQCRILHRGIHLLAVGGRLVYSTCSFNPIEDEAVVSNLLREAQGSVELVDVSDLLPGLKHSRGFTQWKVRSREGIWYEKFSEVPERLQSQLRPSMFPPTKEELAQFNLDKCIRVLPHQQDTGGFFIAAFSKPREVPWLAAKENSVITAKVNETTNHDSILHSNIEKTTDVEMAEWYHSVSETEKNKSDNIEDGTDYKKSIHTLEEVKCEQSKDSAEFDSTNNTDSKEAVKMELNKCDNSTSCITGLENSIETRKECDNTKSCTEDHNSTEAKMCEENPAFIIDRTGDIVDRSSVKTELSQSNASNESESNETEVSKIMREKKHTRQLSRRAQKRHRKQNERGESPPPLKRQHLHGYREDPFIYLEDTDPIWPSIREFFGLKEDFPCQQAIVRCAEGKKRNIYFSSASVRNLVMHNSGKVRFINLGQKVLCRSDSPHVTCDFRMVQEGIQTTFPYQQKRIVKITKEDIVTLLTTENPFLKRMSSDTCDQLANIDQGGCSFLYEPDGRDGSPQSHLMICGWNGKVSCRSFMPKSCRAHYLRLCGAELRPNMNEYGEDIVDAADVADATTISDAAGKTDAADVADTADVADAADTADVAATADIANTEDIHDSCVDTAEDKGMSSIVD